MAWPRRSLAGSDFSVCFLDNTSPAEEPQLSNTLATDLTRAWLSMGLILFIFEKLHILAYGVLAN